MAIWEAEALDLPPFTCEPKVPVFHCRKSMDENKMNVSTLSAEEQHREIDDIRRRFGRRLLILGHHYQKEEILVHADLLGDSFQLSAGAAANLDCETIVFGGVHFMAETADILANSDENVRKRNGRRVNVVIPDPQAGCSMADMATRFQVENAWKQLAGVVDVDDIVPVTYVNSTADLKAFCGENGGSACTSTNARAVLEWALAQKRRVLFFPDQHLGRNTALAMGIPESAIILWDDAQELGGNSPDAIRASRIILWNGFCCVHQKFMPGHIDEIRKAYPNIRVIVHPECCRAVVEKADEFGSTSMILDRIAASPDGSEWAVGTEAQLVGRLAKMFPNKTIHNLAFQPSFCETMDMITLQKLLTSLRRIESDAPKNIVHVDLVTARSALVSLERMLLCR